MAGDSFAGSALGVYPLSVLSFKWDLARGVASSEKYRVSRETDHVNSDKFPDPYEGVVYLADGCISILRSVGEFLLGNDSDKPTSGAMHINQKKSEITSTAGTTKLGDVFIKTLTGLVLNPFQVRLPSSNITPQKGWLPTMFPVLSRFNVADWAVMAATQSLFFLAMSSLFDTAPLTTTTVRRDRKDLGTLIVDNRDYESMILGGTIGNS